jgi:CRISPR-associated endoribonuclease Cas6
VSVPFSYQENLTGAFHKWLGANDVHDSLSLYSFSWLQGGHGRGDVLQFPQGAEWFISAHDGELLQRLISGIMKDPAIAWGMEVEEVQFRRDPVFGTEHRFLAASPILIQRRVEEGRPKQYYFHDSPEAEALLTETFHRKLEQAGLDTEGAQVRFDRTYSNRKVKLVHYDGLGIKTNICPVIVSGTLEAVRFAWNVGVGNSTGIGFGALL